MTDQRQHRSPKPRERRRVEHVEQPPRCRPTLFARFVRERLVEVEHRHIARRHPSEYAAQYLNDSQRAQRQASPFDEGCRGECVGRRDVLPLSYLDDDAGAHSEVPPVRPDIAVGARR